MSSTTSNNMDSKEATLEKEHYSLHQCAVMISTAVCFGCLYWCLDERNHPCPTALQ